jgi:prepilin-type processing-associated H-X9-DG protein
MVYTNGGGGAAADVEAFNNPNSAGGATIFRCPEGLDTAAASTPLAGPATSHIDFYNNSGFWRRQSLTLDAVANSGTDAALRGAIIDAWYGVNANFPVDSADLNSGASQTPFPMRVIGRNRVGTPGRMFGGPLTKQTQIKRSGEMAMLFDGVRAHNLNTGNISARHGRNNLCNVLFADWHVDAVRIDQLPDGKGATSDLRSVATLVGKPFPIWRLDQR